MIEKYEFEEFVRAIRSDIADQSESTLKDDYRVNKFTEFFTSAMAEYGVINEAQIYYLEKDMGRGKAICNGWFLDPDEGRLDIFTTCFNDTDSVPVVGRQDIDTSVKRAFRVFELALKHDVEELEPAHPEEYDMLNSINDARDKISHIRIFFLTDGKIKNIEDSKLEKSKNLNIYVSYWDIHRLYKICTSGRNYEPIEININERFGTSIPCLPMPANSEEYSGYLAIIPGNFLADLYDEFGSRMLELNVRSFLQQRGKVNRGIRNTILNEPTRFLAYNNGISVTVESIETERLSNGALGISKISGLQVVNGGQTVASIHRAMRADRYPNLEEVAVQAKITVVKPDMLKELVPKISRFSNTQNVVNEADFSSNDPFHVKIDRLSETIWCLGEQSRWFYERARGQYEVSRNRQGITPTRRQTFDNQTPKKQKFTKTDLAKYLNAWDQNPHTVSLGAQKNFSAYMSGLYNGITDFEPDVDFYKDLISIAIIFKNAERAARKHKFPAYRANAIYYTVALISYKTVGRLDLKSIWDKQDVSNALESTINDWMPLILDEIVETAGDKNVTEWAKKPECWEAIQLLDVEISPELENELSEGDPLPNVGRAARKGNTKLSSVDRNNIARVMQVHKDTWRKISDWGQETNNLADFQYGIANTLALYSAGKWHQIPSVKQARQAVKILDLVKQEGLLKSTELTE